MSADYESVKQSIARAEVARAAATPGSLEWVALTDEIKLDKQRLVRLEEQLAHKEQQLAHKEQQIVLDKQQQIQREDYERRYAWWAYSKVGSAAVAAAFYIHPRYVVWRHHKKPYSELWQARFGKVYPTIQVWDPSLGDLKEHKFVQVLGWKTPPGLPSLFLTAQVKRHYRAAGAMTAAIAVGLCPFAIFDDVITVTERYLWRTPRAWKSDAELTRQRQPCQFCGGKHDAVEKK